MNNIEKAIEILEDKKKTVAMCLTVADCIEHNSSIILAIQALKEKQERDKGCEYCNNEKEIDYLLDIRNVNELYGYDSFGSESYASINYCPMCGKELK